jgi:hypothetical protein
MHFVRLCCAIKPIVDTHHYMLSISHSVNIVDALQYLQQKRCQSRGSGICHIVMVFGKTKGSFGCIQTRLNVCPYALINSVTS